MYFWYLRKNIYSQEITFDAWVHLKANSFKTVNEILFVWATFTFIKVIFSTISLLALKYNFLVLFTTLPELSLEVWLSDFQIRC